MRRPARRAKWREVKRRPVQGNPPDDRILRGPDCHRPRGVCADSFPVTPLPRSAETQPLPTVRFPRHPESIAPMKPCNPGVGSRLPLVGAHSPVQERDGRNAPCSSIAMSSDRLFLDRVARQHCPSLLHRQPQNNTPSSGRQAKADVSTLPERGHFYFALTLEIQPIDPSAALVIYYADSKKPSTSLERGE